MPAAKLTITLNSPSVLLIVPWLVPNNAFVHLYPSTKFSTIIVHVVDCLIITRPGCCLKLLEAVLLNGAEV